MNKGEKFENSLEIVFPITAGSKQCQVRDEAIDQFLWHWSPNRCFLCQRIRVLSQPSTPETIPQRAVWSRSPTTKWTNKKKIISQVFDLLITYLLMTKWIKYLLKITSTQIFVFDLAEVCEAPPIWRIRSKSRWTKLVVSIPFQNID